MNNEDNNVTNENIISQKEKNKKGKAKFLIIGFLVIIAIAIGLYVGYKKLNNDPLGIYKDTINGIYRKLNGVLKDAENKNMELDINEDPVTIDLKAKLDSNMIELKNFTGLDYRVSLGIDLKNKKMNTNLNIEENNNSLLNLALSIINNNIYVNVFDKVIDLGKRDIFSNFNINSDSVKVDYDNYDYILKELKDILIKSLDKNKFKMEDANITINNKEYKGKKAIYNLDQENIERTLKFFRKSILKDTKLMEAIAESFNITSDELSSMLEEEIDYTSFEDIIINLYTDKFNNLIAGSIEIQNEGIINFDYIDNDLNINFDSDEDILKLQIKDNLITITYKENDIELFKISLEENNNNLKIPFTFNIENDNVYGSLEFNNIKTSKNSASAEIKFSVKANIEGEDIDLTLTGSYSLSSADIKTIDPTGSEKLEDISEEEAIELFSKLSNILAKFGLEDLMGY